MRIDAHQHFWIYEQDEYPWMDGEQMEVLRRDHLPGELVEEQKKVGLEGSVAVQARQTLKESHWLLDLADRNDGIKGVVGWVDLRAKEAASQLEDLSRRPQFVGVRHVAQDEPDDRFLCRPEFVEGLQLLKDFGLTYDILIFPRQLPAALELAGQLPEQPFVVDHLAKPMIRDGCLSPWQEQMRELAHYPHVCCKLSGMVTEARWNGWKPEDFKPYLDVVFEVFGEDRLMFGSDWPVCRLAASYGQVYELLDQYMQTLPERVRTKVWGANAARFYGLNGSPRKGR